jgi:acetyl-CoA carboxylase carboxyltransferase component
MEVAIAIVRCGAGVLRGMAENRSLSSNRRHHPPTAHTPFPLNLDFGDLNATNSKNQYDIRNVSSILYNLESFLEFSKDFENRENFGGVGVDGKGG